MQTKRDNLSLGAAGLAAGTTAGTFKTQNVFPYEIAGRSFSKAVTDNIAFTPKAGQTALAVPANRTQVYFLSVDAAGNVVYEQARTALVDAGITRGLGSSNTAAGYTPGAYEWPLESNGYAMFGAVKVATNASGAFTPATTSLAAANQTVTFYNVAADYGVAIPY